MKKEDILKIWLDAAPVVRSMYGLYGYPPMWETFKDGDLTLYSRPCKTLTRPTDFHPWEEVNGIHYQWMRNGRWAGQGFQSTFEYFEKHGASKSGIEQVSRKDPSWIVPPENYFDWSKRVNEDVLDLPFIEGVSTQEKAVAMNQWIKANSDLYLQSYVKLYHATDPSLPIESEGLKPTSGTLRRRSYQSSSGYVYLANTPERAKIFGDLGNGGNSVVYEVIVLVRNLLADRDQLNNQRSSGRWGAIGNSVGESIIYGGGVRVKGPIEPYAIRKMNLAQNPETPEANEERDRPKRLAMR